MGIRLLTRIVPVVGFSTAVCLAFSATGAQAVEETSAGEETASVITEVAPTSVVGVVDDGHGSLVADVEGAAVQVPVASSDAIVIDSADTSAVTSIGLPQLEDVKDGVVAEDGTVVYETSEETTLAVQVVPEGVRVLTVLDSEDAPTRFDYALDVGEGGSAQMVEDGSVLIFDSEGNPVSVVESPWAIDAAGTAVPTRYELSGNTLTQVINHTDGSYVYPIVADPSWSDIWQHIKNAGSKAQSAAKWLGNKAQWVIGKSWSGVKYVSKGSKFLIKKIAPGGLALCAVGAGWAWYRSDASGWVRVGDAVSGCL